MLRRKFV
jgi:hypothetical protein